MLWEKLKAIGINIPKAIGINIPKLSKITGVDLSKLSSINGIRFSSLISIDRSVKVKIENSTVVIDPQALSRRERHEVILLLQKHVLPEAGAILHENTLPTVNAALEALPDLQEIASKLIPIIPPEDIPLLYACLFLRRKFQENMPVDTQKGEIVRVYGNRGRHFSNLCSAGYLETWFLPLYEELQRSFPDDPARARAIFRKFYANILKDLPWTEFVSTWAAPKKVTQHIVGKMKRNIELGVRYLNIHALGASNVKKVVRLLADVEKQTGAIIAKLDQDKTRIFVRLEIPPP